MKQALVLIILITLFQSDVFGQKFTPSETLTLSKSNEPLEIDLNKKGANKQTIFLQKENKKLKDFHIHTEEYSEEYSSVEEINNTELENIDKIVKVNIEHCGCYCNADIYYWLITKDNKWIELPKIEQYNYDIGNTYTEYIFRKGNKNINPIDRAHRR